MPVLPASWASRPTRPSFCRPTKQLLGLPSSSASPSGMPSAPDDDSDETEGECDEKTRVLTGTHFSTILRKGTTRAAKRSSTLQVSWRRMLITQPPVCTAVRASYVTDTYEVTLVTVGMTHENSGTTSSTIQSFSRLDSGDLPGLANRLKHEIRLNVSGL